MRLYARWNALRNILVTNARLAQRVVAVPTNVYVCVLPGIYDSLYWCMCVTVCVCLIVCIFIYVCICLRVCLSGYVYVFMYICMYV